MNQTPKVEQALGRFETALHKLESAMVKIHERGSQLSTSQGETEALRAEQKKLTQELEAVRGKADELADANLQATKRVDAAMNRVKKVLG